MVTTTPHIIQTAAITKRLKRLLAKKKGGASWNHFIIQLEVLLCLLQIAIFFGDLRLVAGDRREWGGEGTHRGCNMI